MQRRSGNGFRHSSHRLSYLNFPLILKTSVSESSSLQKYYLVETGLLAYLLGIIKADQVSRDPLVGQLFENLVVLKAIKTRYNQRLDSNLYFYRDSHGNEIDLLHVSGREMTGVEINATAQSASRL